MINIYAFWDDNVDVDKRILGNKGYNLFKMFQNGIAVPLGFVIPVPICRNYYHEEKRMSCQAKELVKSKCAELAKVTGKEFGDLQNPLIISIRSGAAESMPGMLDTILNVGITKKMALQSKHIYILRSYITFLNEYMYSIYGIPISDSRDNEENKTVEQYKEIIVNKLNLFHRLMGYEFNDSIEIIIEHCICSVFNSWDKPEAKLYRKSRSIPDDMFTAVIIQEMKFGNCNDMSGSGVVLTINPITYVEELYGEYILNGQGVDVVNGTAETKPIAHLEYELKNIYVQLLEEIAKIKNIYSNPQDIEFTFENGKLYILQTRDARLAMK